MSLVQRAIRLPYNLILRHGPSNLKQYFWDREFASGKWNFIDNTTSDCVYPYVEKYAACGSILDLGCGPGNTANELAVSAYRIYIGVDISAVALEKARCRTSQAGRAGTNRFFQSDLLSYVPDQRFEVILLRESIYHIGLGQIKSTFDRYSEYLTDRGVFIVKLWTEDRFRPTAIVRSIERDFDVLEHGLHDQHGLTVLVFRPK